MKYLGRYLKKSPIAGYRLAHYVGSATLSFRYHDHNTGKQATERLTQHEMAKRLKQHIPDKHFRMVRYFGFLTNRMCGDKLPQVYHALRMDKAPPGVKVYFAQMSRQFLKWDPFEYILCGGGMVYRRAIADLTVQGLKIHAREISLKRACGRQMHPGQRQEQTKSEYHAEPEAIFFSGHASLKR